MIPSKRQQKIYDTWDNENVNMLIQAVAGAGKTTTLLQLLEKCQYRTLFLAFNKSIQSEIEEKIQAKGLRQGKAMTIHALGLKGIRNFYTRVKINKGKNYDLLRKLQEQNKEIFNSFREWNLKLSCIYTLMDMNDISRLFMIDDINDISNYYLSIGKPFTITNTISKLWDKLLKLRYDSYISNKNNLVEIDFIDMIYIPVHFGLEIPIYPSYLMIDEAQDLNLLQHKFIENFINQGTIKKWIAVGDKNQAIYGFSGAYSKSFDKFLQKPNTVELPLDICYRCPKKIIDEANKVYNVMEYGKDEEGIVTTTNDYLSIEPNSMVVCRNTKPLLRLYFNLLRKNISCYIKGEDILNGVLRFLRPYSNNSVQSALVQMNYKKLELMEDSSDKGKIKFHVFMENYENFMEISSNISSDKELVSDLIERFKELFKQKGDDAICLCTIHKAKGLECDVVYFLNQNLIPNKYAKTPEQLIQEQNLRYVAITRAKKKLIYLNM